MTNAEINAQLDGAKCYFSCYPDPVQTEMQTYIIAHAAGVGMDPIQLAKDAACITCLSPFTLLYAKLYLLAKIAQVSTDPVDLIADAACDDCAPYGMLNSIDTWNLVNDPSSPSTDPETILRASRCFSCLLPQTLLEVQVYLLMLIVNQTATPPVTITEITTGIVGGGGGGGGGGGSSGGGGGVIPPGRIRSAIVRQQGRIRNGGGLIPSVPPITCTDVPADLIPVITGTYVDGALTSIDVLLPKVCCNPDYIEIFQANDAVGTGAVSYATVSIAAGYAGDANLLVPVPIVGAITKAYVYATQVCSDSGVSGKSNSIESFNLTQNIVSYWKLEEDRFTDRVDSAGPNTLSRTAADVYHVAGKIDLGSDFITAGSPSAALYHLDSADFKVGAGESITFSMWIKWPTVVSANRGLLAKFKIARGYLFWQTVGSVIEWSVADAGGTTRAITLAAPTTGVWHHYVFGYDNASSKIFIYVDGGVRQNAACVGIKDDPTSAFTIGNYAYPFTGYPASAYIDEVGMWKRVLGATEAAALYNSGAGLAYPF